MANDKKFVVKNGLQANNIAFVNESNSSTAITASMLSTDTLSFSGNTGQLFSISDSMSGVIFAVNDISGVPSIEVDDTGDIRFAELSGNVSIGTSLDTHKLYVQGNTYVNGTLLVGGTTINSTFFGGVANNADYLDGQHGSYYAANSLLSNYALLSGATFSGGVTFNSNITLGAADHIVLSSTSGISANGTYGAAGQMLTSNGSSVYWSTPQVGDITAVTAGNGLTGGGTSGDVTVNIGAGTGITVNADDIAVNAAYIATISSNNATYFDGATWAAPKAIGGTTANTGAFTTVTTSGILTSTAGANAISLTNGTSNWIAWNTGGVAAPTLTTRSAGTKLVLYPNISASAVDYALGIENSHVWFSAAVATSGFKWYSATTNIMTANTTGLTHSSGLAVGTSFSVNTTNMRMSSNTRFTQDGGGGTGSISGVFGYHPEGEFTIHPFLANDLANLRHRGGTLGANTNTTLSNANFDQLFDAAPTYMSGGWANTTANTVLEFTNIPQLFYGSGIGISFGSASWAPNSITIEAYSNNAWVQCYSNTAFSASQVFVPIPNNASPGTTAIRFTMGANTTTRIAHIWAYDYNSAGWTHAAMPRAGGQFYGNVSINSTSSFTIGTSTINATTYSGTANNATYLNGQLASYYTNATNITTGTLPYAQIPSNIVNTSANFTIAGAWTFNANATFGAGRNIILSSTSGISANGTYGTAGQVLHSNGTAVYWDVDDNTNTTYDLLAVANTAVNAGLLRLTDSNVSNDTVTFTGTGTSTVSSNATHIIVNSSDQYVGTVTSVGSGNGLTGGPITSSGSLSVLAGTGVVSNATGVHIGQDVATTAGVIFANVTIQNNATRGILTQTATSNSTLSYGNVTFTSNGLSIFGISTNASNAGDSSPQLNINTGDATGAGGAGAIFIQPGSRQSLVGASVAIKAGGQTNTSGGGAGRVDISGGNHTGGGTGGTDIYAGNVVITGGSVSNINATTANKRPGSVFIDGGTSSNTTGRIAPTISIGTSAPLSNITIGSATSGNTIIYANGNVGTDGQVLTSNGTATYWATPAAAGLTGVTAGSGLTGGGTSGTVTLNIGAGTGITVNADDIAVNAAYIATISSNNATYLNGQDAAYYTNASNISTGTLAAARLPSLYIGTTAVQSTSAAQAVSGITTLATGNTTITGFANVSTTLQVEGISTFNANVTLGAADHLILSSTSGISANSSLGTAGQVLTTNGTAAYWATASGGGGTPGGANTQIQFNDSGAFGGTSAMTFNKTSNTFALAGNLSANMVSLSVGNTTSNTIITGNNIIVSNTSQNVTITNSSIAISSNTLTLGSSSVAANGYSRLPNGLLIQWGNIQANTSVGNVTFPTPFATQFCVVATSHGALGANIYAFILNSNNTTANVRTANTTARTVDWFAIGI